HYEFKNVDSKATQDLSAYVLDAVVIFLLHIKRNIGLFLLALGVAQEADSLHMAREDRKYVIYRAVRPT
uniref:hypothetical protein n=1 Tax=Anaerobutyricum hallii TaxID=39488 RepID=UPI00242CF166